MQVLLHARDAAERAAVLAALTPRIPLVADADLALNRSPRPDVVWLHAAPAEAGGEAPLPAPAQLERLRAYLVAGGRCLLTGAHARCLAELAEESVAPELETGTARVAPGELALFGVMALPGQPLFRRAPGGVYLRQLRDGAALGQAVWRGGQRPAAGRVLGVEKTASGCAGDRVVLVEHKVGLGRIVTLGAHLVFGEAGDAPALLREQRARFVGDLVDYLLDDIAAEREVGWPETRGMRVGDGTVAVLATAPLDSGAATGAAPPAIDAQASLCLVHPRGAVLHGSPAAGVCAMWAWPARAFHELAWTVRSGAAVVPLTPSVGNLTAAAVDVTWSGAGLVVEQRWRLATDGFALLWRNSGEQPLELEVTGLCDLALLPPHPAQATGELQVALDAAAAAFDVGCARQGLRASWRSTLAPTEASFGEAPETGGMRFTRRFALAPGAELQILLGAALLGAPDTTPFAPTLQFELEGADTATVAAIAARMRDFVQPLASGVRGLLAGHATMPGAVPNARLATRDALLAVPTWLAFGGADVVADTLRALAHAQAPDGKIASDLNAAGVAHYVAADATPLFVDAVARTVTWTGDAALRAELWPAVTRALEHLREADRDGDGILEALDNGATFSTAVDGAPVARHDLGLMACELRAWAAGAVLAAAQGDSRVRQRCAERERFLAAALQERAVDAVDAETVSAPRAAVLLPFALGLGRREAAESECAQLSRSAAVADWSPELVGMLANLEFRVGRPDAAWQKLAPHLRATVARGGMVAVGDSAQNMAGQAALLGALAEGLLGVQVDDDGRVVLEPSLPGALESFAFAGLRVRGQSLSGRVARGEGGQGLCIDLRADVPVELELAPFFAAPAEVRDLRVGETALDFAREEFAGGFRLRSRLELHGAIRVTYDVVGDLLVVGGSGADPAPRLVSREAGDDHCVLQLWATTERARLAVALPGREPIEVVGGELEVGKRPAIWLEGEASSLHTVTMRFARRPSS